MGVMLYHASGDKVDLYYETRRGTCKSDEFIQFLKNLRDSVQFETIHIVLDNASIHRSKQVQEYVEGTNGVLHHLPPYTPQLNPIEKIWSILKRKYVSNVSVKSFDTLKRLVDQGMGAIEGTLHSIGKNLLRGSGLSIGDTEANSF